MRPTEALVILQRPRGVSLKSILMTVLFFRLAPVMCERNFAQPEEVSTQDPWDQSQVMMPADLAKLLVKPQNKRPLVVCVGFEFLYKGAHIPMSQFAGPGTEAQGIDALRKWASRIPHHKQV